MKGRRLADALADEVLDALARAGCTLPPRPDVVAAVWPAARTITRAQKHLRKTEANASRCHEQAEVLRLTAIAISVAGWQAAMPPQSRPITRMARFDFARTVPFGPAAADAAAAAGGCVPELAPEVA